MNNDIVPELLEKIHAKFDESARRSKIIQNAIKKVDSGMADYSTVHEFAVEVGRILSEILQVEITEGVLPDGTLYYNIAERLLNSTLGKNHKLVTSFGADIQKQLNSQIGIQIKPQIPAINQNRIDGLIESITLEPNMSVIQSNLGDPIINYTQSIVDDIIVENIEFHKESGFKPIISRVVSGHKPCDWCRSLAGTYVYGEHPDEIFKRHENCRCRTIYKPDKHRKQDVWSKEWSSKDELELRKSMHLDNLSSNRIRDRAEYYQMKELLPDGKVPVSLSKFQELKYNDSEEYKRLVSSSYIQSKFKDGSWLDKVNPEKQARHMQSTAQQGKSYFFDHVDVGKLYEKHKMSGLIKTNRTGMLGNTEMVDLLQSDSIGIDTYTKKVANALIIKYSNTGVHLFPTYYERE